MDQSAARDCLAALAQSTRLEAFRLLIAQEPHGLAAGDIARIVGVPQNTMSSHLSGLAHSGLVQSARQSRRIVYRADLERFRDLLAFLLDDCCGGRHEICAPILARTAKSHPPNSGRKEKQRD
jgi:DNA-binding transcriptional ArsR family regulator